MTIIMDTLLTWLPKPMPGCQLPGGGGGGGAEALVPVWWLVHLPWRSALTCMVTVVHAIYNLCMCDVI